MGEDEKVFGICTREDIDVIYQAADGWLTTNREYISEDEATKLDKALTALSAWMNGVVDAAGNEL